MDGQEFPKVVFRAASKFQDEEALKSGFADGSVQMATVEDQEAQDAAVADGYCVDPTDMIGARRARPPKAE